MAGLEDVFERPDVVDDEEFVFRLPPQSILSVTAEDEFDDVAF